LTTNLYLPPESEVDKGSSTNPLRLKLGKILSWCSLLMLFSLVGITQTALYLKEIFQTITLNGAGDPKVMAGHITQSLAYMVTWLFIVVPGFVFAIFAIYFSGYRSRVFFNLWKLSAFSLLISFPFGSVFGLIFGVILFVKRSEFKKDT